MNYFSVFTGVGGFELGLQYANLSITKRNQQRRNKADCSKSIGKQVGAQQFTCVGFSEIDKYASAVLKYQFPKIQNYGDITKINWPTIPDFDLLVGGSPCQDFSVAGKRAGLVGARSGLFGQYISALQFKKPKYFIWENVKGVLSSNGGKDFARIIHEMAEAGYALWWQVLNAKDFGVPQNRERIFVVGFRDQCPRKVFFETGTSPSRVREVPAKTLRAHAGGFSEYDTYVRCPLRYLDRNQKNIEGDYAYTVDASQTAGVMNDKVVRRLTPVECERLMSWPDDWTKHGDFDGEVKEISDSQRYRMCGNGVVSEVVKNLIKLIQ